MSRTIDHVFCNPVENSSLGRPPHNPWKFLPFSPPIPYEFPLTILVRRWGGVWIIFHNHTMFVYRLAPFLFPLLTIFSPFPQTESLHRLPLRA